jgi:L-amino acid N-acyltransferase YncA
MQIRSARPADAEACRAIYAPYVTDSWVSFEEVPPTPDEMVARIGDYGASHGWWIAEFDGRVVGYAYGSQHRTRGAYKSSCDVAVYVDAAFARRGVGRALYSALLPQLKGAGYHAAFGGIALPNAASIVLHQACGFTPVGVYHEVGWKLGGWRDVSWWQRLL